MRLLFLVFLLFHSLFLFSRQINPLDITIVRDSFGVPHIFGKTDADVAYGLAWANAEDNFEVMQEALNLSKGSMGRLKGKDGAAIDFFAHAIKARETASRYWEQSAGEEFKKYLLAYCQAINDFANAYPKRVLRKKSFPVVPEDVLAVYVVSYSFLTGVASPFSKILDGKLDMKPLFAPGSNAFAVNEAKSIDGKVYLCINPHFLVYGPLTFYEAHLQSEEGLNIHGTLFQGGTSVFMGNNRNLGWSHTYNYIDAVDVYRLVVKESKKQTQYHFDGQWHDLEERKVKLKVKIKPWIPSISVKRTAWWSEHHGVVLKSKDDVFYGVSSPVYRDAGPPEQYYYMNKATDWPSFKNALERDGLPMFNLVYADKDQNIFYISNGQVPQRSAEVAGQPDAIFPGDTSSFIWKELVPLESRPQVFNPSCGYVFNTNNSPFNATCPEENDSPLRAADGYDLRSGENNRSMRFMELISSSGKVSFDQFKAIKFDNRWSCESEVMASLEGLFSVDAKGNPSLETATRHLRDWDMQVDSSSVAATIFGLSIGYLTKKMGGGDANFVFGFKADNSLLLEALEYSVNHLLMNFGTVEVPFKELARFVRGDREFFVLGYPDALCANYPVQPLDDGRYNVEFADTYTQFVIFGKDGAEQIESLLPFSTTKTADQYRNQLELYNNRQTKTMSLDKEEVLFKALRIYKPIP